MMICVKECPKESIVVNMMSEYYFTIRNIFDDQSRSTKATYYHTFLSSNLALNSFKTLLITHSSHRQLPKVLPEIQPVLVPV